MASLWKKADKASFKMLKIISGAVINTRDAHPEQKTINKRFARGVAKRAVGTISDRWSEIVGDNTERLKLLSSDELITPHRLVIPLTLVERYHYHRAICCDNEGGKSEVIKAYPLSHITKKISRMIRPLKDCNDPDAEILIEALKLLGPLAKKEQIKNKQNT